LGKINEVKSYKYPIMTLNKIRGLSQARIVANMIFSMDDNFPGRTSDEEGECDRSPILYTLALSPNDP
jgi:hypothetical protein